MSKRKPKSTPQPEPVPVLAVPVDHQPEQLSPAEFLHKTALHVQSEAIKAALPELFQRLRSEG